MSIQHRSPADETALNLAPNRSSMTAALTGVAELSTIMVAVLARRIAQLGKDGSGTYNYYADRVANGRIFSDYDLALAARLIRGDLGFDAIHEVGAGVGQLAFLLAWNGVSVVGFEQEPATFRTANAVFEALKAAEPRLMANVRLAGHAFPPEPEFGYLGDYPIAPDFRLRGAPFPPRREFFDTRRTLVLATNLVATLSPAMQFRVVAAMRRYGAALIDVDRFFGFTGRREDRARVFDLFARAGFGAGEPFLDLGASGCYVTFRGHAVEPLAHSLDLDAVGRAAIAFLGDWIGDDANRQRGAGGYYRDKLARRILFESYDIAVAEYVAARLPRSTALFELGAGYGELCLLLALKGFTVTGIESDARRHDAGSALRENLTAAGLDLAAFTLRKGRFPDILDGPILSRGGGALIATNVTSSYLSDAMPRVVAALRTFDHVIVDLARFGASGRPGGDALAEMILAAGFAETARIVSRGNSDIRHFTARRGRTDITDGE